MESTLDLTTRLGTDSTLFSFDRIESPIDPTLPHHRPGQADAPLALAAAAAAAAAAFPPTPPPSPPKEPSPTLKKQRRPSSQWTSFQHWNYGGYKERLEGFLATVNRQAFVEHVHTLTGQLCTVSEPFSAGQYWCCFELVAPDGSIYIARARLPPHPNQQLSPEAARHRAENEIATMRLVRQRTAIPLPEIYAYEREGTPLADKAGAAYMLLEGLHGNSILERTYDLSTLHDETLRRLLHQWAGYLVELNSITFPAIGGVCENADAPGGFEIGPLATDEAGICGPFTSSHEYFKTLAEGKLKHSLSLPWKINDDTHHLRQVAPAIVCDAVRKAPQLFSSPTLPTDTPAGGFPLFHMDLGIHNILVDDSYTIVGVIDWELASTAPPTADFLPMPFSPPLDIEKDRTILRNPGHRNFRYLKREYAMRKFFTDGLKDAEAALLANGRRAPNSLSLVQIFNSPASTAYYLMERQGKVSPEEEEVNMKALVRLAFDLKDRKEVAKYMEEKEKEAQQLVYEHGRERMVVRRQANGKHPWWHASL